jgi:hypothetical protein
VPARRRDTASPESWRGDRADLALARTLSRRTGHQPTEDAEDLRIALARRAKAEPTIPMSDIMAEFAADLDAYPDDEAQ